MGVGAIFISTLARLSLPEGDPDADTEQVDLLRETIVPIVAFLVLSSVLTREYSSCITLTSQTACQSPSSP
jgi:NhaP-type Na+/H+ or K+/H+ antiporter